MHNLFIYRPVVDEIEQRTKLKKRYLYMGDEQPIYKIFNEKNDWVPKSGAKRKS